MSKSDKTIKKTRQTRTNWNEVYVLVKHWKSDLDFYKDELRFLQQLIGKYLIWITKKENLQRVAEIRNIEHALDNDCKYLHKRVSEHLKATAKLMEVKSPHLEKDFLAAHSQLEKEISFFVKSFRESRKEVFKVTEYVMDSEELQNILDN
jgi:uncharacterized protein (UPF0305 family)